MRREFHILSSDGVTLYPAGFSIDERVLSIYCGCPAGLLDKWCKHKMGLISGDVSPFGNVDPAVIDELLTCIRTSQFPKLIDDLRQAEKDVLTAKKKVENAKKALENAAKMGLRV